MLGAGASIEDNSKLLAQVPYIYYPLLFQNKNQNKARALINYNSEVNTMTLKHTSKLGFQVPQINIKAQKINGSIFETFGIILASFQIKDKLRRARFFYETFLLANISVEGILRIFFLKLSNINIQFLKKKLI